MGWNGLERNKLDYILTDLLPVEVSELFSFSQLYSFLLEKNNRKTIESLVEKIKERKAKGDCVMFQDGWSTKPLKYHILKNNDTTREMSIVQPLSALNLFLFIECYQKEILNYFKEHHIFSIRYHKKNTNLYYKSKQGTGTNYFQNQAAHVGRKAIQQSATYFKIDPYESINAFADSRTWRICNFNYKYYVKLDYKSCFDSIYTHAFSWIIERNVVDAKDASTSHLFITIDRVLQNINGRSSNGIIVGPEFSRMMAEILLQHIDNEVHISLEKDGAFLNTDYTAFRYVDDIFIFANQPQVLDQIIEKFENIGQHYLLRINELKLEKGTTPCLPKGWLEKTRHTADTIGSFFHQESRVKFEKLPEDERFLVKKDYIAVDRIKDEIAVLVKQYPGDRRFIVSFLLSTLLNNISKKKDGYTLFSAQQLGRALLLLDITFYIYAFYPAFDQTRKVISILSYINSEINFKSQQKAKERLQRILNRYSFIFQSGNIFDFCDWFPVLSEYEISLDTKTEEVLIQKAEIINDPIIWANLLLYSRYYSPFFKELLKKVELIIEKQISAFCAVWRTLMRFPADIVQSITDAGKRNVLPTTVSP